MTCQTCTHWKTNDNGGNGACVRFPPQIAIADARGGQTCAFPVTPHHWTCGEHRKRRWWHKKD